jgi:hypothetical protein
MRTWEKHITLVLILVFLTSLVMLPLMRVKADSTEPVTFSSGLTLYSPVNTVYDSRVVVCNGTFDCPQGVGCSLNFSIDGVCQGGLQRDINGNSIANPYNYTLDGAFPLPALPNGSHQLSIGIKESTVSINDYNSTMTTHETTWVNTVYFTISSSEPLSTPTPTSIITPTPTIPEFPTNTVPDTDAIPISTILNEFIFVVVILLAVVVSLLLYRRHRKTTNLNR